MTDPALTGYEGLLPFCCAPLPSIRQCLRLRSVSGHCLSVVLLLPSQSRWFNGDRGKAPANEQYRSFACDVGGRQGDLLISHSYLPRGSGRNDTAVPRMMQVKALYLTALNRLLLSFTVFHCLSRPAVFPAPRMMQLITMWPSGGHSTFNGDNGESKTVPLTCVSTAFVATTLLVPCVSTVFLL